MSRFLLKPRWRFLLFYVVPAIVLVGYITFFASDRYESVAEAVIKDSDKTSLPDVALLPVSGLGLPPVNNDALLMRAYVLSSSMLKILDEELKLRDHYQNEAVDFWFRLDAEASEEDFLEYYRSRLSVEYDDTSGVTVFRIQAFDREYAEKLGQRITTEAEAFINRIGNRLARAQLAFMQQEAERAGTDLARKRREVIAFQNKHDLFSPEEQGALLTGLLGGIESELVKAEANLKMLKGYLRADAPEIVAARNQVRALRSQLEIERARLVSPRDDALNEVMAEFQDLKTQFELASQIYSTALAGVEQAQFDVARQMKYLILVSGPTLPDEPAYPQHAYLTATILAALALLYGIVSMLITIVQEHAE